MTVLPILGVGILMKMVAVLFVLVSLVLILVILLQKGRGGGLTAAFGGGMAGGLLGSKTGDFLTWVTIVLVAVFLTLAVLMGRFYRPKVGEYGAGDVVASEQPTAEGEVPPEGAMAPDSDAAVPVEDVPVQESDVPAPGDGEGADANSAGG